MEEPKRKEKTRKEADRMKKSYEEKTPQMNECLERAP
jgi:hypothetical protein